MTNLQGIRKQLLAALRVRNSSDAAYKHYCELWSVYATARIAAGRRISAAEYKRLHGIAR
jgi:hypothetical protein